MNHKAILRIFGLLAMVSMIWAAAPSSAKTSSGPRCTCGKGQSLCVYSNGSCTCLGPGQICIG